MTNKCSFPPEDGYLIIETRLDMLTKWVVVSHVLKSFVFLSALCPGEPFLHVHLIWHHNFWERKMKYVPKIEFQGRCFISKVYKQMDVFIWFPDGFQLFVTEKLWQSCTRAVHVLLYVSINFLLNFASFIFVALERFPLSSLLRCFRQILHEIIECRHFSGLSEKHSSCRRPSALLLNT